MLRLKCYVCSFLLVTLAIFSKSNSSHAASLETQEGGRISFAKRTYFVGNKQGEVFVRYSVSLMPAGGTARLRRILADQFPEWSFPRGRLNGSFKYDVYYPCAPGSDPCGPPVYTEVPVDVGVGAIFRLTYDPAEGNPKIDSFNRVNWIQRVTTNHRGGQPRHNLQEDGLDNPDNPGLPYYYTQDRSAANFEDFPSRIDIENPHFWNAELFLVQREGYRSEKRVVIYEGVRWGWGNNLRRRRNPVPIRRRDKCPDGLMLIGNICTSPLAWSEYCVNSDLDDSYPIYSSTGLGQIGYGCEWQPIYDNNSTQASRMSLIETETKDAASVSEPGTMAAVLAVGLWSGVSWRKRRQ
jgi:hypothetical protein